MNEAQILNRQIMAAAYHFEGTLGRRPTRLFIGRNQDHTLRNPQWFAVFNFFQVAGEPKRRRRYMEMDVFVVDDEEMIVVA
jgi:recombinational DNA repair ATPase RecF